jgi:hypothetical protein
MPATKSRRIALPIVMAASAPMADDGEFPLIGIFDRPCVSWVNFVTRAKSTSIHFDQSFAQLLCRHFAQLLCRHDVARISGATFPSLDGITNLQAVHVQVVRG